jgi:hypothetical protein
MQLWTEISEKISSVLGVAQRSMHVAHFHENRKVVVTAHLNIRAENHKTAFSALITTRFDHFWKRTKRDRHFG